MTLKELQEATDNAMALRQRAVNEDRREDVLKHRAEASRLIAVQRVMFHPEQLDRFDRRNLQETMKLLGLPVTGTKRMMITALRQHGEQLLKEGA